MFKRLMAALLALAFLLSASALAVGNVKVTLLNGAFEVEKARSMLDLINALRTGSDAWYWNETDTQKVKVSGLNKLKYDYGLERVAMQRAAELALSYSHTRPNGASCFTAYPDALRGYNGENIAYGYNAIVTAKEVFVAWAEADEPYKGQGHRRNMLGSNYNTVGVGCFSYNGKYYWAQEFSSKVSGDGDNPLSLPVTAEVTAEVLAKKSPTADGLTLKAGEKVSLAALPLRVNGFTCNIDGLTWTSDKASVARISADSVTGAALGTATLTGKAGEVSVAVPVTVADDSEIPGGGDEPGADDGPGSGGALDVRVSLEADDDAGVARLLVTLPEVDGLSRFEISTLDWTRGEAREYAADEAGDYVIEFPLDRGYALPLSLTVDALDAEGEALASSAINVMHYPSSGALWLPGGLKTLGEAAVYNTAATCVIVPNGCTAIESDAFAACGGLASITIPASVKSIAPTAFDGCDPSLIIAAPAGSAAADLAERQGFRWFELG